MIANFSLFATEDSRLEPPLIFTQPIAQATEENQRQCARNLLRLITAGWQIGGENIYKNNILTSCINQVRDPVFLNIFKEELERGYEHLVQQLNTSRHNAWHAEIFIHNCMAIYPFLDPASDQLFRIPQYIEEKKQWELINFTATPIELTPKTGFFARWIKDSNRVYSYGFTSIESQQKKAYLVHSGTTYPTGQGIGTQQFTNLLPGFSVGGLLYRWGKASLKEWIMATKTDGFAIVNLGASLGGSLALHCDCDRSLPADTFEQTIAFNPAAFLFPHFTLDAKHVRNKNTLVIKQSGDLVSHDLGGFWPAHCRLLSVTCNDHNKLPPGFLLRRLAAHIGMFIGYGSFSLSIQSANDDNYSLTRLLRWLLLMCIARTVIFILKAILYENILKPSFIQIVDWLKNKPYITNASTTQPSYQPLPYDYASSTQPPPVTLVTTTNAVGDHQKTSSAITSAGACYNGFKR